MVTQNSCACKEQSKIFHLLKAFDKSKHKQFFSPKRPLFLHSYATFSELPSNLSTINKGKFISICLYQKLRDAIENLSNREGLTDVG